MEPPPSVKSRMGSPPIPPNYVSLRQLQELRLKAEEEKQLQEAARKAEMEKKQRQEAARKAEMEAMAAAAVAKQEAAQKPETKVSALGSMAPDRAHERRGGRLRAKWVAVTHRPAVPPPPPTSPPRPTREEGVDRTIGVGRGNRGQADAPRGGGRDKPEGKAKGDGKEEVSAITSAQTRTDEPGTPAEPSTIGGRPGTKALGGTSAEPGSIGRSGGSAGASSRRQYRPKGKKGAGGRRAEPSPADAPAKISGASTPQGIKLENDGACRVSDSSDGKKADARPAPPTSASAGSVGVLRTTAETKPERQGRRWAEQKPRVSGREAWPRPPVDRCNGAREQHGRVWVPKAASGCSEL